MLPEAHGIGLRSKSLHTNTLPAPVPVRELGHVVLEGLDFAPRCSVGAGVEHCAEAAVSCRRCGSVRLLCFAHVAWLRDHFESQPRRIRVVECVACHEHAHDWDEIAKVVTL